MAYCEQGDVKELLGEIPLPAYISAQSFTNNAADEIDTYVGRVYRTPVVVDPDNAEHRPTRLILKKINSHLAAGRLIMALDASGQDDNLQAYAAKLVGDSLEALAAIAVGEFVLPGADPNSTDPNTSGGPAVANLDATSYVEDYYGYFNVVNFPYAYSGEMYRG